MKKLTLALVAATALVSAPALAADLGKAPVAPARAPVIAPAPFYNWSGFYIGIQGGFGAGELEHTLVTTGITETRETSGGLIGGTVGFNWQTGAWVFGVEADYAWADISRRVDNCIIFAVECKHGLDTFGTARIRVGYAWGPALIYATGGFAFGDHVARITDTITGASIERNDFALGWTAGAGFEWGFSPGWSFKAEVLVFDLELDRLDTTGTILAALVDPQGIDTNHFGLIVRGGINYRFNWGGPPAPVIARY